MSEKKIATINRKSLWGKGKEAASEVISTLSIQGWSPEEKRWRTKIYRQEDSEREIDYIYI